MKKAVEPMAGATLNAAVVVAAMSRPKIPPFMGEGAAASTVVVTVAMSSPKLPPMYGD